MKKKLMDKKFIVQLLPVAGLLLGVGVVVGLWTPDVWIMGNYYLIMLGALFVALVLVFVLYGYVLLSKTSKRYPKGKLVFGGVLSLVFEMIVYAGILTVSIHFDLLHVDMYVFLLLVTILLTSMIQKIGKLGRFVDEYQENPGEKWESLISEVRKDGFSVWYKLLIVTVVLLLPVAVWINLQLGVALGVLVSGFLLPKAFGKIILN